VHGAVRSSIVFEVGCRILTTAPAYHAPAKTSWTLPWFWCESKSVCCLWESSPFL